MNPEFARITRAYTVPPSGAGDLLNREEPTRVPSTAPVRMAEQHTETSLGISFWYPVGWEIMDGSEPGTPRVLVIGPYTDASQPPAVVIEAIDNDVEIDAYVGRAIKERLGSDTYITISGPSETIVGGSRALVTVTAATGQDESETLRFHEIAIEHERASYSVVYMSALEDYEEYLPHLMSIVETMKHIDSA